MLNQVLESVLAFMVALLALSISVIARARPTASSTSMNSERAIRGEPMIAGNGLAPLDVSPAGSGPTLWAVSSSGSIVSSDGEPQRASPLGRRYEARHVRGRLPVPPQPGRAGPPWGPAAPPPGLPPQGSERWF